MKGIFGTKKPTATGEAAALNQKLVGNPAERQMLLTVIHALLLYLKSVALDVEEVEADDYRERIDLLAEAFGAGFSSKPAERTFARQHPHIPAFIDRQQQYLMDRDGAFKEIIRLLTEALSTLNDGNHQFHDRLSRQSDDLEAITRLDDIRGIKSALEQEIVQLRHMVTEKQEQDAQRMTALNSQVDTLSVEVSRLRTESQTDGLTGVGNRKAFDTLMAKLVARSAVTATPFSLLMMDLDDFKQINDSYGHPMGDRVLVSVARKCTALIRSDDFIGRYGGEEFGVVLLRATRRQAMKKARQICKSIAATEYAANEDGSGPTIRITVSIGVSEHHAGESVQDVIDKADKALYEAKKTGKNKALSC